MTNNLEQLLRTFSEQVQQYVEANQYTVHLIIAALCFAAMFILVFAVADVMKRHD